jgi:ABC-type Fe3+/spermidine/putrescine transport system ATPase subunit
MPLSVIDKKSSSDLYFSIDPNNIKIQKYKINTGYVFEANLVKIIEQIDHYKIYANTNYNSNKNFYIKLAKNDFNPEIHRINKSLYISFEKNDIHIMKGNK